MGRIVHHKLVRDRIPEIIRAAGQDCATRVLTDTEYVPALLAKALEEVRELAEAAPAERIVELGDVREVLDALMAAWGIDEGEVARIQAERREERGGFGARIFLEWTEDGRGTPGHSPGG